ncbi:outer membrane protein transport protein [Citreimonas salinaria]|uniref:Long-chain fatty acid transport protein n=1 Tax=Citreimonas salinaria TaxID=321339 RepID=A0A1H3GGR8_9RHOB|nr:outer membrane protein transport protein [Citreimonas salinaria]SDY02496.1 Long-chain fatty acid transport protein [Citreimonas salinaria]
MKKTLTGAAIAALAATGAQAGGLDRSGQSVSAIFDEAGTAKLNFGYVIPSITGEDIGSGGGDYDVGEAYIQPGITYTNALKGGFNYAIILDKPYGADVSYDDDPTTSNLGGTMADLNSQALTFVGRYALNERFSVFAGLGVQSVDAEVALNGNAYANAITTAGVARGFNALTPSAFPDLDPALLGRALNGDGTAVTEINSTYTAVNSDVFNNILLPNFGTARGDFVAGDGYNFEMEKTNRPTYLLGAAYEIPSIAMRIAGTYRFETEHTADTTETVAGTVTDGEVEYVTPQSFNLEAQTGVAPGTLVTLGYRWTEFSAVDLVPERLGSDLVDLDDSHRYTLGIGRQFNEQLAGSASISYEPTNDRDTVSPLGPTDGLFGVSLGARYNSGALSLSGGVNYTWLGDADAGVADRAVASFEDNHAVGIGLQAALTF